MFFQSIFKNRVQETIQEGPEPIPELKNYQIYRFFKKIWKIDVFSILELWEWSHRVARIKMYTKSGVKIFTWFFLTFKNRLKTVLFDNFGGPRGPQAWGPLPFFVGAQGFGRLGRRVDWADGRHVCYYLIWIACCMTYCSLRLIVLTFLLSNVSEESFS